jgi:hypothetical protein
MERIKIIIIFNYVVGRDFLGLVISIEQPKFQSEFKETTILQKVRKLICKLYIYIVFFFKKKPHLTLSS